MQILQLQDIERIASSILNDAFLKKLLSQKKEITDPTKNILNSDIILRQQLIDCFIPFVSKILIKESYTYSEFIKEAYPENPEPSDTKERTHFKAFEKNVINLKEHYDDTTCLPPFIPFITSSITSNCGNRKQTYRNYNYKFFNARSYSYIMRNNDCIPYFHKNNTLSKKELLSFYGLFTVTESYPLIEQIISQYFIDSYFSIHLFNETLIFFDKEHKQLSLKKSFNSLEDYGFYMECFLFLCSLLQNASGMYAKHMLFCSFREIFFGSELKKWNVLFSNSNRNFNECFVQCALEFVFYYELIYPYVQNLFSKKLQELLDNNFPNLTKLELHKQFSNIIKASTTETNYRENMSIPIQNLKNSCNNSITWIDDGLLNYIMQKFYKFTSIYPDKSLIYSITDSECPYPELMKNISLVIDTSFCNLKANYYSKNAGFPI